MMMARCSSLEVEAWWLRHWVILVILFEVIFLFLSMFYKKRLKRFKLIFDDIFFVFECKVFTKISNSVIKGYVESHEYQHLYCL